VLLEPYVKVEVECPTEYQGGVVGDLSARRGLIRGAEVRGVTAIVTADVPLACMFGYSTDLRSQTQGAARSRWSSPATSRSRPPCRKRS